MEAFVGKWKLESGDTENFDKYMSALGVGMIKREMGKRATPTQEITKGGDNELSISTCTGKIGFTTIIKFTLGEEFEETTLDGRKVKTKIDLEGNKLVQTQPGDTECKITREIQEDGKYLMTLEIPSKDVTVKRIYAKQ